MLNKEFLSYLSPLHYWKIPSSKQTKRQYFFLLAKDGTIALFFTLLFLGLVMGEIIAQESLRILSINEILGLAAITCTGTAILASSLSAPKFNHLVEVQGITVLSVFSNLFLGLGFAFVVSFISNMKFLFPYPQWVPVIFYRFIQPFIWFFLLALMVRSFSLIFICVKSAILWRPEK